MEWIKHTIGKQLYIEINSMQHPVSTAEEALQLLVDAYYQEADGILLHKGDLTSAFFDLKTGLAGEILQKCSNYRMKMGIVGDFTQLPEGAFKDFVYESNKGKRVVFVGQVEEALRLWH
jgi:hypothetical protein